MSDSNLLLEIGVLMLVAFAGATIANKGRQSVILGYIAAGMLIGPYIGFELGGISYHGFIQESSIIDTISEIGLVLLIFFVGLEFSFDKIKKVKGPAVILSLVDVGINLFAGFLLAAALGWPLIDAIFLAAVIAMSCSAVAMKTLMEMGRLNSPETHYIMGMIVLEEFISMLFLTIVCGFLIPASGSFSLSSMVIGMGAFFAIFAILAFLIIPKVVAKLARMRSDEMFVLFMLGVICVFAALAEICGVPALIGAFFIGMVFAETKVMDRMERSITPIRDAFAAVFFVSFGMMIDISMMGSLIWVIIGICAVIVFNEMIIVAAISYLVGFSRGTSETVGAAFSARGGESIMYATVGREAAGNTKGAELVPIAGGITFIMCALCPMLIRRSYRMADWLAARMPKFMSYGGAVMSRTLGKMVMPGSYKSFRPSRRFITVLGAYIAVDGAVAATSGEMQVLLFAAGLGVIAAAWLAIRANVRSVSLQTDYANLLTLPRSQEPISKYIASAVGWGLLAVLGVAFTFELYWPFVLVILSAYAACFMILAGMVYIRTCDRKRYIRPVVRSYDPSAPKGKSAFRHRTRWKEIKRE